MHSSTQSLAAHTYVASSAPLHVSNWVRTQSHAHATLLHAFEHSVVSLPLQLFETAFVATLHLADMQALQADDDVAWNVSL